MFHELLENPNKIEPGHLQASARKLFPDVVRKSHLELFTRGQSFPQHGKYVLIGVAVYSPKELQLLDAVDAAYSQWRNISQVAVFDLMEYKDRYDLQMHFLSPPMYQPNPRFYFRFIPESPVVGLWDGSVLTSLETGFYGAEKLLRNEGFLQ
jgi:hypothetical protein